MKIFLNILQSRKFQLTSLSTLFILWSVGPYIAIAGKTPLETLPHRMIASILAIAVIFLIEHFRGENSYKFDNTPDVIPENIQQELNTLQDSLKQVFRSLYKNTFKAFIHRYKKPWYLLLGPTNAGKTTFLTKAGLNVRGLDNLPPTTITPTKFFNWWLSDDAVFIDVGGRYLRENRDIPFDTGQLFRRFFLLLKRYRSFKPINGLIVTVNLQELTVNPKDQTQLTKLAQIINELSLQFRDVPIYVIVTRCDVIEGFTEFFEDLAPEERNQIFGMSFPRSVEAQSLPQVFNEEYNSLLTRLNERVIWRLHKESNPDKLGKIKNFPLQMEFLKNSLGKLLNIILPSTNVDLRGIFFISALQKDMPIDNLTKTLSTAYDIHHLVSNHRSVPSKSFFINDLFKRVILPDSNNANTNNSHVRFQFWSNVLIIIFTLISIAIFYNSYETNREILTAANQALLSAKNVKTAEEEPMLHELDLLQTLGSKLNMQREHWYSRIGMQESNKLYKKTESLYNHLLTSYFQNYLKQSLEIQLENIKEENSNQLYSSLKTYLMLGDPAHFDKKYFVSWFENYWHQTGKTVNEQLKLTGHLTVLLQHPIKSSPLNIQAIENTRALLNNMPQSRLVLTILQNQYQRSPIKLLPDAAANLFTTIPREIPGIYDIRNFRNVYYSEIDKTCQEITRGNWVLDKKAQPSYSDIVLNQLASEVKAIYINEYAVTWAEIMNKIKMDEFQNLTQIVDAINLLNNPESPLLQLINTIKNNTQPISDSVEFTQQVSTRFLALNALSADVLKNTNQTGLIAVRDYLNRVVLSPDSLKSSYDAAKTRMENQNGNDAISSLLQQARMLPEPLRTWHTTIAAESWRIILKNTQAYLNRIWIATVYPQYAAVLNNRYPLFKESPSEISLADFNNFFGNNGVMDTFFKTYLQPFVDSTTLYWEWKNVDGQKLNIAQPTLEMFIRAALIQKMFFSEDVKQAVITFSLVPSELDPSVQSFTLDLEGQQVNFQKDNEQILTLSWPGPGPSHTDLVFVDDQGKRTVLSETGSWSWFRVLDKSKLEATANPKHFRLTFGSNGTTVHYELYANGIVNPFIPGILNSFRCPENL